MFASQAITEPAVALGVEDTASLPPNAVPALRAALAVQPGRTARETLLAAGHVSLLAGTVEVRSDGPTSSSRSRVERAGFWSRRSR